MIRTLKVLLYFLFSTTLIFSQTNEQLEELRTVVTLLDYVSKDYVEAVENGEIIDEAEYQEQIDFAEQSIQLYKGLLPVISQDKYTRLSQPLDSLLSEIHALASPEVILNLALYVKNRILDLGLLKISPTRWPSIEAGRELYAVNCASCHGPKGFGDGKQGVGLEPAPSSFRDDEAMDVLSPLQAYNVIKLGVEGTGMVSYDKILSEDEIWDLAFYIMSMRYDSEEGIDKVPANFSLDSITIWRDSELKAYLTQNNQGLSIGTLRNHEPKRGDPMEVSREELEKSYQAYKAGDKKLSIKHALTSYLEGIELVESTLKSKNPEIVRTLEKDMVLYRRAIEEGNDAEVERLYLALVEEINEAKGILSDIDYSFAFIYGASLSILLREALEALLIILVILSILKPLGIKKAITAVHIGWIAAVLAGVVSWIFVDSLIHLSGASRELMEAIGSIIAVVVLLYAGTWLHSHSEISKWSHFVKTKIDTIKDSGNWIGLAVFSFIIVFREAFEVVLFLSSLKLNNPEVAGSALAWALFTSVIVIAIITFVFLKTTKKLPITKIFKLSAYVIAALAVVLTGKGVSALQEAGWVSAHHIDWIKQIDLLGIYPTVQTIVSQIAVLFIIIVLTKWKGQKKLE